MAAQQLQKISSLPATRALKGSYTEELEGPHNRYDNIDANTEVLTVMAFPCNTTVVFPEGACSCQYYDRLYETTGAKPRELF